MWRWWWASVLANVYTYRDYRPENASGPRIAVHSFSSSYTPPRKSDTCLKITVPEWEWWGRRMWYEGGSGFVLGEAHQPHNLDLGPGGPGVYQRVCRWVDKQRPVFSWVGGHSSSRRNVHWTFPFFFPSCYVSTLVTCHVRTFRNNTPCPQYSCLSVAPGDWFPDPP